jgi:hypothetical protein
MKNRSHADDLFFLEPAEKDRAALLEIRLSMTITLFGNSMGLACHRPGRYPLTSNDQGASIRYRIGHNSEKPFNNSQAIEAI